MTVKTIYLIYDTIFKNKSHYRKFIFNRIFNKQYTKTIDSAIAESNKYLSCETFQPNWYKLYKLILAIDRHDKSA